MSRHKLFGPNGKLLNETNENNDNNEIEHVGLTFHFPVFAHDTAVNSK